MIKLQKMLIVGTCFAADHVATQMEFCQSKSTGSTAKIYKVNLHVSER